MQLTSPSLRYASLICDRSVYWFCQPWTTILVGRFLLNFDLWKDFLFARSSWWVQIFRENKKNLTSSSGSNPDQRDFSSVIFKNSSSGPGGGSVLVSFSVISSQASNSAMCSLPSSSGNSSLSLHFAACNAIRKVSEMGSMLRRYFKWGWSDSSLLSSSSMDSSVVDSSSVGSTPSDSERGSMFRRDSCSCSLLSKSGWLDSSPLSSSPLLSSPVDSSTSAFGKAIVAVINF